MRILFWSSAFWPSIGGVQVLAGKLLPALEQRGYQHVVVSTKAGCETYEVADFNGIPVHYFPFWKSMVDANRLAALRKRIADLKKDFAPDLIHINGVSRDDFFHHLTSHVHPVPLLITLHNGWLPQSDEIVTRTLRSATWVVACSEATLAEGRQLVPDIASRSSVIYNGLDIPPVEPKPVSFDPPRLLCVGRLIEDKGFDLALDALALLLDRFPQIRLTVAGDGPARAALEQQAAALGLGDAVEFRGWVASEDVLELVGRASAVVVPSRWQEPFALVALEAALMGRPVAATRVGGLPEVIVHEQTGLLVEPENASALADAIAYLITNPDAAVRMGQVGRRRAVADFGFERYADAYDDLYRKLVHAC